MQQRRTNQLIENREKQFNELLAVKMPQIVNDLTEKYLPMWTTTTENMQKFEYLTEQEIVERSLQMQKKIKLQKKKDLRQQIELHDDQNLKK